MASSRLRRRERRGGGEGELTRRWPVVAGSACLPLRALAVKCGGLGGLCSWSLVQHLLRGCSCPWPADLKHSRGPSLFQQLQQLLPLVSRPSAEDAKNEKIPPHFSPPALAELPADRQLSKVPRHSLTVRFGAPLPPRRRGGELVGHAVDLWCCCVDLGLLWGAGIRCWRKGNGRWRQRLQP